MALLDVEIKYRKSKRILFYEPMEKQEVFHRSIAKTRAIFGGNRSGKTTAGGMEFLFHITGLYPKWYPEENKMKQPVIGRIAAQDFNKGVGEVIVPFLEDWLDPTLIQKKQRNPIGIPVKWVLKNGSRFDILTYEMTVESYEGWRGHIAWFDEPPPRDMYVATMRGLVDYHGKNWLTLTPIKQPWIYDSIYTKADGKVVFVVTTDIKDNKYLSAEAIADFESKLSTEEKEARLHGRFLHLTGLVYKDFNPMIHICEPPQIKEDWTRYFCIDPHPRTPTACLWLAVDPKDNHYVYDELWLENLDIEQVAHAIHAQEGSLSPRFRFIDPHMDKDNELAGGFNIRKELMKHGVFTIRASSDPFLGKSRIKAALKPKYNHMVKTEMPQLKVSRNCQHTIYEFEHYLWADRKRDKDERDPLERTLKKNDHFMDCLRYIYNFGPRYIIEEEDEEEITYEGTYTKYPTKSVGRSTAYHKLVEGGTDG